MLQTDRRPRLRFPSRGRTSILNGGGCGRSAPGGARRRTLGPLDRTLPDGYATSTTMRPFLLSCILFAAACSDQGPTEVNRLRGVWRVDPRPAESHCVSFGSDRSFAYEVRRFHPDGRPADSLGSLQRFLGKARVWPDSIDFGVVRLVIYSWFMHRTTPIVASDTTFDGSGATRITITDLS